MIEWNLPEGFVSLLFIFLLFLRDYLSNIKHDTAFPHFCLLLVEHHVLVDVIDGVGAEFLTIIIFIQYHA